MSHVAPAPSPTPAVFEYGFTFGDGTHGTDDFNVANVRYRRSGESRWSHFVLVGDPGETLWSLEQKVAGAIRRRGEA